MNDRQSVLSIYRSLFRVPTVLLLLSLITLLVQPAAASPIPERIAREWGPRSNWPVLHGPAPGESPYIAPRAVTIRKSVALDPASAGRPGDPPQPVPRHRSGASGSLLIVVTEAIYSWIPADFEDYMTLLENDGWLVELVMWTGSSPADLRALLQDRYAGGTDGAWLVGDLPVAWFMLPEDFGADAFPTDLYYSDLNGEWLDNDSNGILDTHTGHVYPEIFIGRLLVSNLTYTGAAEHVLVHEYLAKAMAYRAGNPVSTLPPAACADTGFASDSRQGSEALTGLFGSCTRLVTGNPDDYVDLITGDRPWASVYAHGNPEGHYFEEGVLPAVSLPDLGLQTRFFADFSCSNARYTETDYMGGWYVSSREAPLGLVGSTKTGSLYYVNDLTAAPARGLCLGRGLLDWSVLHMHQNPVWFYGVTLLGDPSLPVLRELCIDSCQYTEITGDGDGIPEAGERLNLTLTVRNASGWTVAGGETITLSSEAPEINLIDPGPLSLPHMEPGESGSAGPFVIDIDPGAVDGAQPVITMDMEWSANSYHRPVPLTIAAPLLRPGQPAVDNPQNHLVPGGFAPIYLPVTNAGAGDITDAALQFISHNPYLNFPEDYIFHVTLQAGETAWVGPVQTQLDAACPDGELLPVELGWGDGSMNDAVTLIAGGGLCFDPGDGWNGVTHEPATPHTFDQWRREPDFFHCGRPDGSPYNSGMDAALVLPEIIVDGPAWLDLTHEMNGEISWGDLAYDGGRAEIITGSGIEVLYAAAGYPFRFELGNTAEPGSPCWADNPVQTDEFVLPVRPEPYGIRFRFASDGGLAYNGWKIHGIRVMGAAHVQWPGGPPHPVPPCDTTGVTLLLPAMVFHSGDTFYLDARICNATGAELTDVELICALEVGGIFWFWPSWSEMNPLEPDIESRSMNLPTGNTTVEVIPPFAWPPGAGDGSASFFGMLLEEDSFSIIGEYDYVAFSWEE